MGAVGLDFGFGMEDEGGGWGEAWSRVVIDSMVEAVVVGG